MPADNDPLKTLEYETVPPPGEPLPFKILKVATGILMLALFFAGIFCAILTIYWIVRWPNV